jgi:hypothetical protein
VNHPSIVTIIACWLAFVVYWIDSARGAKPAEERQSLLLSMPYRAPLTAGGILLVPFVI